MLRRHHVPLRKQVDLLILLAVITVDLGLTVRGIQAGAGIEVNPFFAPFTASVLLMAAGIAAYYTIIVVAGLLVTGAVRHMLASLAFGAHVAGAATWIRLLYNIDILNLFWFIILAAGSSILFYAALYRR